MESPMAGPDEVEPAAMEVYDTLELSSVEEADDALRTLSHGLALEDARRSGFIAVACRSFLIHGCDPSIVSDLLVSQLGGLLEKCVRLHAACETRMKEDAASSDGDDQSPTAGFERAKSTLGGSMADEVTAWEVLKQVWPCAIELFSRSVAARMAAHEMVKAAAAISSLHEAGHWLRLMLSAPHDEPLLAIEPSSGLGIEGRVSGVVDNYQLHALLMDCFPRRGLLKRRRISRRAVDTARGTGPQVTDDTIVGAWNMWTWQAIQPSLDLPDPGVWSADALWVWGEGIPADIPVFEGFRVVLLGPPSYERSWRSQRMFARLPANLEIAQTLSRAEVTDWLGRMGNALRAEQYDQR